MTETILSGASPFTSDKPAPSLSKKRDRPQSDCATNLNAQDESSVAGSHRNHRRRRRFIILAVVAALLVGFVLIAVWGMASSDWLYGTYGGVRQSDWDEITRLRDELVAMKAAPSAIAALDDALLIPHPSTEDVIFNLRRATLNLQARDATETTRELATELRALISQLQPGYAPSPTENPHSLFPRE